MSVQDLRNENSVSFSEIAMEVSGRDSLPDVGDCDDTVNILPSEIPRQSVWRARITVSILFFVNLLNYMDRFTIAGVLTNVIDFYGINNADAGLLQTVFIACYMVLAPVFGYLGDRFNRKILLLFGLFFWSATTLAGSFIGSNYFWAFLLLRGIVGIGEASYSTIAPTIIADLYAGEMRSRMLAFFYFAIPVGSGLGYIAGSKFAEAMGQWQWALRITPGLGVLCLLLIWLLLKEPKRGEAEAGQELHLTHTSYIEDITHLVKIKSFVWSTLGFTCVAYVTGALALWGPNFMERSLKAQKQPVDSAWISLIFGIITCIAGFVGVGSGSFIAQWLKKTNPRGDPLVCAFGLLTCMPFLFLSLVFSRHNTSLTWALIFVGETLLCLNWAIVADILLYVVVPTRRSTAEAIQILISHLFGDAGSPYLVGVISDAIAGPHPNIYQEFSSMQYALFTTGFVAILGGLCFLLTAIHIEKDRQATELLIKEINTFSVNLQNIYV